MLGCNLFCYCKNNPIMYYDPKGRDALIIWKSTPWPDGHLSLIVQDGGGTWWFFSWADINVDFRKIEAKYMKSIFGFNKLLSVKYTRLVRAKGDTVNTFICCKKLYRSYINRFNKDWPFLSNENFSYHLMFSNCGQAVMFALSQSFLAIEKHMDFLGLYNLLPTRCFSQCSETFNNASYVLYF